MNITECKPSTSVLHESNERYKFLVDNTKELIFILDKMGKIRFVNKATINTSGYTEKELIGKRLTTFLTKDSIKSALSILNPEFLGHLQPTIEVKFKTKSGETHFLEVTGGSTPIRENRKMIGLLINASDITQRKNMNIKLRDATQYWERTFNGIKDAVCVIDNENRILLSNTAMTRLVGKSKIQGLTCCELIHGSPTSIIDCPFLRAKVSHRHESKEMQLEDRCFNITVDPIKSERGKYIEYVHIATDITEKKKVEETLKQKEEYFRSLIENSSDVTTILDSKGIVQYQSPNYIRVWGRDPTGEIGKDLFKDIHPDDVSTISKEFKRLLETPGNHTRLQVRAQHEDRSWRVLDVKAHNLCDNPSVRGIVVNFHDITERKKAEEALREGEEKWTSLTRNTNDIIMMVDSKGIIQYINKTLPPYTPKETIGKTIYEYVPKDHHDIMSNSLTKVFKTGEQDTYEVSSNIPKIGTIWFSTKVVPVKRDRVVRNVILISTDITESKKAEDELRQKETKYRTLVENLPQKIFLKDKNSVYMSCNDNYARDLKIKSDEIIGKTDHEFYPKELAEKYRSDDKRIMELGKTEEIDEKYVKNGQEIIVHTVKTPIKDENGNTVGVLGIFWDITKRKKTEEALKKSHQLLNDTGEMAKVGGWELDLSTNEVSWTEEVGHIHGVEPGYNPKLEEALNFYAPESRSAVEAVVKKAAETGEPYDLESLFIPLGNKDKIWVRSLGKAVYSGGRIVKLVGTFQNIDKYKRADEALWESEMNYRELANSIKDVFFAMDKDLKYIYWNKASEKLTGIEVKDAIGKSIFEIFPDTEDTKKAITKYREAIETQQPKNFVNEYQLKDKKIFFEISAYPSKNGLSVFVKDITERKRAEEEIRYLKDYNENILESNPNPMMVVKGTQIEYVNKSFVSIFGETKNEYITRNLKEVIPSEILPVFENLLQEDGGSKELKFRGKEFNVRSFVVKKEEEEARRGILFQDITERKRAEETLKESDEKLRSIVENSSDQIFMLDKDCKFLSINKTAAAISRKSPQEMIGMSIFEIFPETMAAQFSNNIKNVFDTGKSMFIDEKMVVQGREFYNNSSLNPLKDGSGRVIAVTGIVRDITERKAAEKKIKKQNIQLKKLDHIKTDFLNTTSHELRTPLAAIKGYIQMLLKQILGEINEEQKKALEVILRNTNRLDHLVQDILDISRLESDTMKFIPENIDVEKMVKEIAETMQASADLKRIKIDINIQKGISDLMVDQERIKQVLMNLVDNAIKFSPVNSIINVNAKMNRNHILFEIQDYGEGIPKNKQKKIFEKFYQIDSGEDRKFGGTGLGLTISQKIVNAHGGKIWVDSTLGKGSTFKFSIPSQSIKNTENRFKKEINIFELEK
jgi:PAS domain S-box-containing protein